MHKKKLPIIMLICILTSLYLNMANTFAKNEETQVLIPVYKYIYEEDKNLGGYINLSGEFVIAPQFQFVYEFSEGLAKIYNNKKYGFINTKGEIVKESQFDDARNFSEGLAAVKIAGKYGFINTTGSIVIEPQFDDAREFSEGYAAVKIDDKYGVIDTKGELLVKPQYTSIYGFSEGMAMARGYKDPSKFGYINTKGELVVPIKYEPESDKFSEGLAFVAIIEDGVRKGYYIDKTGKKAIKHNFFTGSNVKDGFAIIHIKSKGTKLIDKQGNSLQDFGPYRAYYSNGLIRSPKNGKTWAFYNVKGEKILDLPENVYPKDFSEGIVAVYDLSKKSWGYMNMKGKLIVDYIYNSGKESLYVSDFKDGYVNVRGNNRNDVINTKGEIIYSFYWNEYNLVKILVRDKYINYNVLPEVIDFTTYVPLRDTLVALGFSVEWNSETSTVVAKKNNTVLTVNNSNGEMKINDEIVFENQKPILVRGATLVPVRFLSQGANAQLSFDNEKNIIHFKLD